MAITESHNLMMNLPLEAKIAFQETVMDLTQSAIEGTIKHTLPELSEDRAASVIDDLILRTTSQLERLQGIKSNQGGPSARGATA
jgi:hypothetical protein